MEALGAFPDGEWDSFTAIFSSQELDVAPHCLDQCSFPMEHNAAITCPTDLQAYNNGDSGVHKSSWFCSLDAFDPNLQYIKQDMSSSSCSTDSSSSVLFANPSNIENYCCSSDIFMSIDEKNFGSFFPDILMQEEAICVNGNGGSSRFENVQGTQLQLTDSAMAGKELPLKRKHDVPATQTEQPDGKVNSNSSSNGTDFADNQKKKTRVSGDAQENKKTQQSKKIQKIASKARTVEEEGNAAASDGQTSISDSLEDDHASPETHGGSATSDQSKESAPSLNGKTRASRGSATDPQSLYARKRRERINERLRILQKLVPNGTKVDISTMLEEAVHYVKFLQLQIKLLSSDEMWMYAPLAYNGMDIGLQQKLSPFLSH